MAIYFLESECALSDAFIIELHKVPNRCYARVVLKVGSTNIAN